MVLRENPTRASTLFLLRIVISLGTTLFSLFEAMLNAPKHSPDHSGMAHYSLHHGDTSTYSNPDLSSWFAAMAVVIIR
jgi:hypothetical protein